MAEKSFLAGAAEPVIRFRDGKRKFTDKKACDDYISAMAKRGGEPYRLPKTLARFGDIGITEGDHCGMQYFTVDGGGDGRIILYLHGGSYFAPPHLFHWDMLRRISALSGAKIFVPIYPRAPIHACSAAYVMLRGFYREFFAGSRKEIIFMGDSAGGGLALGLAEKLAEEDIPQPKKIILLSPWLDVSMDNPEMRGYEDCDPMLGIYGLRRMGKLWAGELDVHDPRVSPIYGDLGGLGRIHIFVGTHEIFYPEALRLSRLLTESGAEHTLTVGEGMNHVWVCYPMREGREAIERIAEIILSE